MHALRGNAHLGKLRSVSAAETVEEIEKNITELIASHEHFISGGELCFHVSNRSLQRIARTPYFIFCDTLLLNTVPRTLSANWVLPCTVVKLICNQTDVSSVYASIYDTTCLKFTSHLYLMENTSHPQNFFVCLFKSWRSVSATLMTKYSMFWLCVKCSVINKETTSYSPKSVWCHTVSDALLSNSRARSREAHANLGITLVSAPFLHICYCAAWGL